jgi:hypothetical protein
MTERDKTGQRWQGSRTLAEMDCEGEKERKKQLHLLPQKAKMFAYQVTSNST